MQDDGTNVMIERNSPSMKLFVLAFVPFLLQFDHSCESIAQRSRGFAVIDDKGGWSVPVKGKPFGTITKPYGKEQRIVKVLRYRTLGSFALPRHYETADGALELQSFYSYADEIDALEYDGARFSYLAIVNGKEVSMASSVRWLDMDGRGVFTRLVWGPEEPDIPQWALAGKKN